MKIKKAGRGKRGTERRALLIKSCCSIAFVSALAFLMAVFSMCKCNMDSSSFQ